MQFADNQPRIQRSALAIITAGLDGQPQHLLQWNNNWHMFNLVGGKMDNSKGDNDNFARTIRRELWEELGLRIPEHSRSLRELQQVYLRQYSHRERRIKDYHFVIFELVVQPRRRAGHVLSTSLIRDFAADQRNVLVTPQEIENLSTHNGQPISATTRCILHALGWFSSAVGPYHQANLV